MAQFNQNVPQYKPGRDKSIDWNTFRRGLNTLLQDNEIKEDELSQTDNIMLTGRGVPTKRWGSALYYQAGNATGSVRSLKGFYKSNSTIELVALTDDGYLTAKSNASYRTLTGVSWASNPSGYRSEMAQLNDSLYIVHPNRELVRYSNPTLVGFPTIQVPAITGASNLSNASGTATHSYRVTAISQVGETLGSTSFQLGNQPDTLGDPAGGAIRITWGAVSTASGILQGYNVYGRGQGNERFLAGVPASSTDWIDDGSTVPLDFTFSPTADSTAGPRAKNVVRFQDRLVFAGLDLEPSKVLISGRVPFHERFDLSYGGNYIQVEPNAGDNVVQLFAFADRIIVFKEHSIWQITLASEQVGNFYVTQPTLKLITASHGCIAPGSVVAVGNDVFFLSRNGVKSLGYQEGFSFDVLRTNDLSIKVRPFFDNLTTTQLKNAVAVHFDNKYLISFPGKGQTMIFDRERAAWIGPWNLDATSYEVFYDDDNDEHLLFSQNDSVNVNEYSEDYTTDSGTAISTILRTRNEDFGDWSLFKNIKHVFVQLRNVTGTVYADLQIETRNGQTTSAKSFNITPASGNAGWGADLWGDALWGDSNGEAGGIEAIYTIRWANLNKTGRLMKLTFRTTDTNANYELLGIRAIAKPLGLGNTPSSWRI